MDNTINIIEKKLANLQTNIEILIEALNTKERVLLTNNDIFKSIISDINLLKKYDNKDLKALFVYYRVTLSHLNKTFSNKEIINKEEMDNIVNCLNDIKKMKEKINDVLPFNKFIEDLKSLSINLNNINSDFFLRNSEFTKNSLVNYENILNRYKNIVDGINELKASITSDDFENLKLDLNINYSGLKANLSEIFNEILISNVDIADPLLNKLKKHVNSENYEPILRTNMVNKVVSNGLKRKEIINNYNMLIESLNKIVDRYKYNKVDRENVNIDIELSQEEPSDDYGIDIPHFIEENYDEHRNILNKANKDIAYDSKVPALIARFEILKRKLDKKNSLTKEEVKLYNKLESELELLKSNSTNRYVSSIKFNHYYKLLNKRIKVSRNNNYMNVTNGNKKRK